MIDVGRKPLLAVGSVFLSVIGIILVLLRLIDIDHSIWVGFCLFIIYIGIFGLSHGPVTYFITLH